MIMEGHNSEKRLQFGSRYLKDESKVFEHNAWDDVEWDSEIEEEAKEKIKNNSIVTLSSSDIEKFELDADKYWDAFYCQHQNKFFKDRNWLFTEFEELAPRDNKSSVKAENEDLSQETRILEVGCGVGNTVFPIMQTNNDSNLFIYCCDFAESAIAILKSHQLYDLSRCHAFVCDIAGDDPQFPCPPNSIDFIVLIFVLSAIHPERMESVLKRLSQLLKPGGMILFRDYGRYDMAQLRFKPGKCLSDNFYVRGDGTRVYFFTQEELDNLFTECGLNKVQNVIDRRLQVNRGRQLKMYRVWVQCKYQKPFS